MTPRHLILPLLLTGAAAAQEAADLFAFIPPGGRTLLEQVLTADDGALAAAIATPRGADDWLALLSVADSPAPGLDEWGQQTLADYLAYAGAIGDAAALPPDGRDMMLARCQSCHIITVTVTQMRSRDAWLATLGRTSHVGVPLTAAERGQLADYLAINAGLPIDVIPPELRAGGATY